MSEAVARYSGAETSGPLSGIRVVESGSLIAGPFCAQLLGDFGAEVIKVEDPRGGDPMRQWGSLLPQGVSLSWPIIARNKKSVTCNLREPAGQEIMRRLVAQADVLVENFRPGTLERWGLGYDELSTMNPGLVLVRVTGYGQTGPYARRAGFGSIGEAMGGIRHVTGEPDRAPSRAGISLGDSLAGTFAALGTVMALLARERNGRGQVVDSAIYEAVLALMESLIPEWDLAGSRRERTGSVLPGVAPSNVYPTRDGGEVLIAANRDTVFYRLCGVMGREDLQDNEDYRTHAARGRHQQDLDQLVSAWTRTLEAEDLLARLHEAGVPAGLIYTAADMLADPHFQARQAIVRLVHDKLGEFPMQNVAPRLSGTPGAVRSLGPELGQHNDEIYGELLGADEAQREQWVSQGII
ncbi:CoA transferase [Amycolatopsis acidiphila]|uniref:CoA transferase n=1 Tax=Amycolatopsis acidiphila TaxID=715473 RepID=A0A558AL46_9PSEU|nr:CoA transferase [Amycolatopsis acidiphila]TVT24986.1 CoA transferase [Amycolatopsis acidiphila]UIJ57507.1 CoA transferase [Amycolatopsis acidiphila]